MKLTTAGQAGSRNNGPATTHFRDVGEEGILHLLDGGTGAGDFHS
jgi:hypothetical protein